MGTSGAWTAEGPFDHAGVLLFRDIVRPTWRSALSTSAPGPAALDGREKAQGAARFVADRAVPGCLHGAVVRSPHAHAQIRGIRLDLEYDWSDVVVATAADIPQNNEVRLDGGGQPILASKVVRYAGEAVVLVAAPTRALARDAAARIHVDYRPLPALDDPRTAQDHARVLHAPGNVYQRGVLERGAASATATGHRLTGTYDVAPQAPLPLEPLEMLARPTPDGIEVSGPIAGPRAVLETVRAALQQDRVQVRAVHAGGSFGRNLLDGTLVAAQAAVLAGKSDAPVRLAVARREESRSLGKRAALRADVRSVTDDDGRLLSLEIELLLDGGAYPASSASLLDRALAHAAGPYEVPALLAWGRVVATNRPPASPARGGAVGGVHFALDRHLDAVARHLGLDASAVRRANLPQAGQRLLDTVVARAAASDPPPVPTRSRRDPSAARLMAGRGFAVAAVGGGPPGDDVAERRGHVELALRKGRVRVHAPGAESGQGADTGLAIVVARALGIAPGQVEVRARSSARVSPDGPVLGSRTLARLTPALRTAARRLHEALRAEAGGDAPFAELLAARTARATLRARAGLDELPALEWDAVHRTGTPYRGRTWQAVAVDIAVDADTGEVDVRRVVTATQAGPIVHPALARAQIEGAVLHGIGSSLSERVGRDARGLRTATDLRDSGLWGSAEAPEQDTLLLRPAADSVVLGLGEIGVIGVGPALAQAIEAATGAVVNRCPMGPQAVLMATP